MGSQTNSFISQDMLPYQEIILKLRHRYNSHKLEDEIRSLADSTASVFLIKMELKKLASEASRILDFRHYFKDHCNRVEIAGLTHYLDDKSERLLRAEYKRYGGRLTIGAVGIVMQDAKKRHKNTPATNRFVKIPDAECMSLTQFYVRKEERLFFTKAVKMYCQDPSKLSFNEREEVAIDGVTTNISLTGISIRFSEKSLTLQGGKIFVHMSELESEFRFKNKPYIPYTIIKSVKKQGYVYLMLTISADDENDTTKEFARFITNYVNTQRGKYRISAENTEKAATIKSNEQFVVNRLDSLPVFFTKQKGAWIPAAQFFTNNNEHVGKISNNRDNKGFLVAISKLEYIQNLLNTGSPFTEYLFIFPTNTLGTALHYLCIPYRELISNGFLINEAKKANNGEAL